MVNGSFYRSVMEQKEVGVMPKEVFTNQNKDEHVEVRWYNMPAPGEIENIIPVVALGVGRATTPDLESEGPVYETRFFNFETPEQVDDFIKSVKRAKRKVFG